MTAEDVLEALRRLDAAGVGWWIDGGWGVDALLDEQTRPHDDLDFAIWLDDVARPPAAFPEFGRVIEHEWPGAYVLVDEAGRRLDFHPLELDGRGDGWQRPLRALRTRRARRARRPAARLRARAPALLTASARRTGTATMAAAERLFRRSSWTVRSCMRSSAS